MPSRPELKLDWATAEAARYACEKWHYSKCVPVFKAVRIGVWEDGKFIGVVLFGQGATPEIGSPYGLRQVEICELTRVALTQHVSAVSKIIALSLRFLRKQSPGLRMVVSFADAGQGHHGGIYQAGGWIYVGGAKTHGYRVNGTVVHPKTLHSRYGKGGQSIPWCEPMWTRMQNVWCLALSTATSCRSTTKCGAKLNHSGSRIQNANEVLTAARPATSREGAVQVRPVRSIQALNSG